MPHLRKVFLGLSLLLLLVVVAVVYAQKKLNSKMHITHTLALLTSLLILLVFQALINYDLEFLNSLTKD